MDELASGINWSAVLAGAVFSYLVGWLWYSPEMFGEKWANAAKVTYTETPPAAAMVRHFGGIVLLSWFVGVMPAKRCWRPRCCWSRWRFLVMPLTGISGSGPMAS